MARKTKVVIEQEKLDILKELKKLTKTANQRLLRLERATGRENSWAARGLRNRLDVEKLAGAWSKSNRITFNQKMTLTQLENIKRATERFLYDNLTSTVRGIKQAKKNVKTGLLKSLDIDTKNLSDSDYEFFNDLFNDPDELYFINKIGGSTFYTEKYETIENREDEKKWIKRLNTHIDLESDKDIKIKAISIYDKLIKPYI